MSHNVSLPSKLFIEPTTRCNFKCAMCVKQADTNGIIEGDLSIETFEKLVPTFKQLDTIIFSGIGEPLLHPNLETFIHLSRQHTPDNCKIGLQSNGSLLSQQRLSSLVEAGLNTICLSFDAIAPDCFQQVREGGEVEHVKKALKSLQQLKQDSATDDLTFGIEFVLMKSTAKDLLDVIQWSADNGASFAIVTHVLPYAKEMESEQMNSLNLNISHRLYDQYRTMAEKENLDLDRYLQQRWKYQWNTKKTPADERIIEIGEEMIEKAYRENIPLHFENLINEDAAEIAETKALFDAAKNLAQRLNLTLTLPELHPKYERQCHFVEEKSAFISWDGQVYPCYYLWHQYGHFLNGMKQRVAATAMGNLNKTNISEIWNHPGYSDFRENVLAYDYPYCSNCILSPCNLFTEKTFEYDCYTKTIPCGGCPWCGGLLNCLQ